MMNDTLLRFTVPLAEAYRQAEQFSQGQRTPQKQEQVRLNTLAVWAVDYYLQCLGIETDLANSNSWNRISQALLDTGELSVPALGDGKTLECRPILPGAETVYVPPETRDDRCGYLAVQIDESQKQATILGFLSHVQTDHVPLSQLRSLDAFLDYVETLETEAKIPPAEPAIVNLSRWLQGVIDEGWQAITTLIDDDMRLAYATRSVASAGVDTFTAGKLIRLGMDMDAHSFLLLVGLGQEADGRFRLSVRLCPAKGQMVLPANIALTLISQSGTVMSRVQEDSPKDFIQLKPFKLSSGSRFYVQISLNQWTLSEEFVAQG